MGKQEKNDRLLPAILAAAALVMVVLAVIFQLAGPDEDASTPEGRTAFLASMGWEIDAGSEERKSVRIPDCGSGVMADYNDLQLKQGYDLSRYVGKTCTQYSYRVTNYPGYDQTVYATLYVSGRRVIAGDIHSAALNGFMHTLHRDPAA